MLIFNILAVKEGGERACVGAGKAVGVAGLCPVLVGGDKWVRRGGGTGEAR